MAESDRFVLSRASDNDFREALRATGIEISAKQFSELLRLLELVGDKNDEVKCWSELPRLPPNNIGLIFSRYYYNINVKRLSLTIAAAILDAVAGGGLASASLAVSGLAKQGIAKLNTASGEYCALVHSAKLKEEKANITPEAVHEKIYGTVCPFVNLNCRLMREGNCCAGASDVTSIFDSLKEKGALEKDSEQWKVPL